MLTFGSKEIKIIGPVFIAIATSDDCLSVTFSATCKGGVYVKATGGR